MDDDLVQFLRARLDEDEAVARAASEPESWMELHREPRSGWYVQHWADPDQAAVIADPESSAYPVVVTPAGMSEDDATARVDHIARHDPARVLVDVEAKRRLLEALLGEPHAVLRPGGSTEIYCGADYGPDDPCDCGRDERVGRRVCILVRAYHDHPDFDPAWLED